MSVQGLLAGTWVTPNHCFPARPHFIMDDNLMAWESCSAPFDQSSMSNISQDDVQPGVREIGSKWDRCRRL